MNTPETKVTAIGVKPVHLHFCYVASMYPDKVVHALTLADLYQTAYAIDKGYRPGVDHSAKLEDIPTIVQVAVMQMLAADRSMDIVGFLINLVAGHTIAMPEGVAVFSAQSAEAAKLLAYEEHIFGRM